MRFIDDARFINDLTRECKTTKKKIEMKIVGVRARIVQNQEGSVVVVMGMVLATLLASMATNINGLKAGALLEPVPRLLAQVAHVPGGWRDGLEARQAVLPRFATLGLGLELGALLDPVAGDPTEATDVIPGWVPRALVWCYSGFGSGILQGGRLAGVGRRAGLKVLAILHPVPGDIAQLADVVPGRRATRMVLAPGFMAVDPVGRGRIGHLEGGEGVEDKVIDGRLAALIQMNGRTRPHQASGDHGHI